VVGSPTSRGTHELDAAIRVLTTATRDPYADDSMADEPDPVAIARAIIDSNM
jgi:hypothetical protein